MGSTFTKVRKYNLNSSGDPTVHKYNPIPDEEVKPPLPPPLPADEKVSSIAPRRRTPRERAWRYDPKDKDPKESDDMFTVGYPPRINPHYFGFHVTDEMQIPSRYPHHYVKSENEPREYKYPDYRKQHMTTNLDASTTPPPGISISARSIGPTKPDTASDPNPKPHQKYYSADDINKLLKPLKFQNITKLKPPLSYYTLPYQESYNKPRYQTLGNPLMYDTPQYKCCHNKDELHKKFEVDRGEPPPYSDSHLQPANQSAQNTQQKTFNTPGTHNYSVSNPYLVQEPIQDQFKPSHPYNKYHTIHNDNRIPLHQRQEFSMNSMLESSPPPRYVFQQNPQKPRGPFIPRPFINNHRQQVVEEQTRDNETDANENVTHPKRHRREVFFRTDPVSRTEDNPNYTGSATYPGSPSSHYCYTIPEEPTWLPPFHYNPARSSGYRHH